MFIRQTSLNLLSILCFLQIAHCEEAKPDDISIEFLRSASLAQLPGKESVNLSVKLKNESNHEISFLDDTRCSGIYLYVLGADGSRKAIFPFDPAVFAKRLVGQHVIYRAIPPGQSFGVEVQVPFKILSEFMGREFELGFTEIQSTMSTTEPPQKDIFSEPFHLISR